MLSHTLNIAARREVFFAKVTRMLDVLSFDRLRELCGLDRLLAGDDRQQKVCLAKAIEEAA